MEERFSLAHELNRAKDTVRAIVKCLNSSINASSPVIARTIIEIIAREHVHTINSSVRKRMEKFRRKKHLVSNKLLLYLGSKHFLFF